MSSSEYLDTIERQRGKEIRNSIEVDDAEKAKRANRNARARANRAAREDALKSCGLKKVKGALGGTYWE